MKDKICLITGSNEGLGYGTARLLAAKGATIILHARNELKAEIARRKLQHEYPEIKIETVVGDLASLQQVRDMAGNIQEAYPRIDVLINNAGLITRHFTETSDGFEMQFGVNHLAHFLLTHLLMPQLQAAPQARVINVSSFAHYRLKEVDKDWHKRDNYHGFWAYCQSKLCNVLFTAEFARRFADTNITANSLHPGGVDTAIGQKHSGSIGWLWWAARPFLPSPEKAASTSVYLASSKEVEGLSGKFFIKSKEIEPAEMSKDEALAKRLWKDSEEMVGVKW